MRRRRSRAFSLLEVTLSTALLSVLLVVLASALRGSQSLWRQTTGASEAEHQLRKACAALQRDIPFCNRVYAQPVPGHLAAGGFDGDVVWFTSPVDPATGLIARKANGSPLYLRNVLYYLIEPQGHAGLYGYDCPGGMGPGNYDDRCPHKVLVRKVIDFNGPSSDEATEEQPMLPSEVLAYLTQPTGLSVASMTSESGGGVQVGPVRIVAHDLLWFSCNSKASPNPVPVELELRATNLLRARKSLAVGSVSLYSSGLTEEMRLSLLPTNP